MLSAVTTEGDGGATLTEKEEKGSMGERIRGDFIILDQVRVMGESTVVERQYCTVQYDGDLIGRSTRWLADLHTSVLATDDVSVCSCVDHFGSSFNGLLTNCTVGVDRSTGYPNRSVQLAG